MEDIRELCTKISHLYYNNDCSQEALDLAREAVKIAPEDLEANNLFALLLTEHKYYDEAEKYARKALEISRGHSLYLSNLGVILVKQAKYEEAEFYLERAYLLDENNPRRSEELARLYLEWGQNLILAKEYAESAMRRESDMESKNRVAQLLKDISEKLKIYDIDAPRPEDPAL